MVVWGWIVPALRTDEILRYEANEILDHRSSRGEAAGKIPDTQHGTALYKNLNECKLAALCLSGGGIRSAAFSLGILQALAAFPRAVSRDEWETISEPEIQERAKTSLLSTFDYLSTVSGGGYIGSWLSACCSREGFQKVWKCLVGRPDGSDTEPQQIGWLRSHSNYLSPKIELMSSDTWTALSIYICNLFLNWLIILPVFCCAILGLKLLAVVFDSFMIVGNLVPIQALPKFLPWFDDELRCLNLWPPLRINWQSYALFCGIPGVLLLITALSFMSKHLLLYRNLPASRAGTAQKEFLWRAIFPSILSAIFVAQLLGSDPFGRLFENLSEKGCDPRAKTIGAPVAAVSENGAAKKAGIQAGDVITEFESKPIKTFGELEYYVNNKRFDDFISLKINRKGESKILALTLSPADSEQRYVVHDRNIAIHVPSAEYDLGIDFDSPGRLEPRYAEWIFLVFGSVIGALLYLIGLLVALITMRGPKDLNPSVLMAWIVSGAMYGAMLAFAFYFFLTYPGGGPTNRMFIDSPALPLTIGVPWILCSQLVAQFVFVGLSSRHPQSELDREWFGRAGGWIFISAIGWFAIAFLTFGALLLLLQSVSVREFVNTVVPISGLSGIATAFLGKSRLTSDSHSGAQRRWENVANIALAIAAPLFISGLIFLLSISLDKLFLGHYLFQDFSMTQLGPKAAEESFSRVYETLLPLGIAFVAFTVLLFCASYFININRFSLHAFYRNRLIRSFLGASKQRRNPDPFHGFDLGDNPRMYELWPSKKTNVWQPFHLVNMTLNLVSGKKRVWRERKAASFTVSPLHCGAAGASESGEPPTEQISGAYRPSTEYGAGISLGTAMAISGAAVSPNMGYHSSPGVTFLMSMLNVRLGWWLGNPAVEQGHPYANNGPTFALASLFAETLGLTTDDRKYVYLSDGGHFDNLGLYEMVRRRCRFILVVDAGYDPTFSFEDLGNAIRKIAIDFDVQIQLDGIQKLKRRADDNDTVERDQDYHAVGEIDYRAADGAQSNGMILYIKPGYHGTESGGIRAYATSQPEFPHQPTIDQWFSESQFESYRALGFEIMSGILEQARRDPACANDPTLESVFNALYKRANKPTRVEACRKPSHCSSRTITGVRRVRDKFGRP